MEQGNKLLQATLELQKVVRADSSWYYKLVIQGNDDVQITLTETDLKALLQEVPNFLEAVIETQVLIEKPKARRNHKNESIDIGNH